MSSPVVDPLRAGREALERHDWEGAYDAFAEADRGGALSGDGLRALADAAWWAGRPEEILDALERAYRAYLETGDRGSAALMAFRIGEQHGQRMAGPVAASWILRAEELTADDPDSAAHGWVEWIRGFFSMMGGQDFETAIKHYDAALEIATRIGDRSIQGRSLIGKGRSLCSLGRVPEGLALMDEAMVAAVGGEMDPIAAGQVYCGMISTCSELGDYQRSAEWTDATTRWCERNAVPGFRGICRVHRAELLRLHRDWSVAEEEARQACEELPRYNLHYGLGYAFYEVGEVRRRMGDFAAAEDAYGRALEFGHEPEPGLSLLRMGQGKLDAAATGVRRAISESRDPLARVGLFVAQSEVAIAAGDLDTAASASQELDSIVDGYEATALHAVAGRVRGALRLARGDAEGALPELRRARERWRELEAPYEVAEIRVLLGKAYRTLGDEDAAIVELRGARTSFDKLGARVAAASTADLLGELAASAEAPDRVRRAFMFTDIVKSTDLVGAIGDEAWEDLLAWHDQTLRSLFAAHGGEVANSTGDGFFVAFQDARSALSSAVAVQRALAEHRRAHGFAPLVRIGVHTAEATRRGGDFSGAEVHKAARIAAAAEGSEILASEETVAETEGAFTVSEPHEIAAKGIPVPVQVARVEWRT